MELDEHNLALDQLKQALEKENEFVQNLDYHKETAEAHLTRVTQAHSDEL